MVTGSVTDVGSSCNDGRAPIVAASLGRGACRQPPVGGFSQCKPEVIIVKPITYVAYGGQRPEPHLHTKAYNVNIWPSGH